MGSAADSGVTIPHAARTEPAERARENLAHYEAELDATRAEQPDNKGLIAFYESYVDDYRAGLTVHRDLALRARHPGRTLRGARARASRPAPVRRRGSRRGGGSRAGPDDDPDEADSLSEALAGGRS